MIDDELVDRLCAVDGVVAVALGGSQARGDHRRDSANGRPAAGIGWIS